MPEDSGWIKLHRAMLDGPIIQHPGVLQVWVYCLLRANWEPRQIMFPGCLEPISVDRGEFVTGRNSLHAALYPTTDKDSPVSRTVWRWLETLELMKCVALRTVSNRCTIVSVLNYKTYQELRVGQCPADVPPVSNPCPAGVPPVSTNKEFNNLRIEESKNIPPNPQGGKSSKKAPAVISVEIPESLQSPQFVEAWEKWQKHRREIRKPLTETQAGAQMAKFKAIGATKAIAAIYHTIEMGWQGIREPDGNNKPKQGQFSRDVFDAFLNDGGPNG